MSLEKSKKQQIIKDYAINEKDTGSPEVQIAVLTEKITALSAHMQSHPQDFHSRRGLMKMVANRRRLLKYVKENDTKRYESLIARLGLRK
ncbi:MAG: 30S ribosomal protein S15 [Pseudomonadota bacterium]|nr:30S ribosomal protein S15 [Pseudomonadota bacterium]